MARAISARRSTPGGSSPGERSATWPMPSRVSAASARRRLCSRSCRPRASGRKASSQLGLRLAVQPDHHVLGNGEFGAQRHVLEAAREAQRGTPGRRHAQQALRAQADCFPFCGLYRTGQAVEEAGLAGAVGADQASGSRRGAVAGRCPAAHGCRRRTGPGLRPAGEAWWRLSALVAVPRWHSWLSPPCPRVALRGDARPLCAERQAAQNMRSPAHARGDPSVARPPCARRCGQLHAMRRGRREWRLRPHVSTTCLDGAPCARTPPEAWPDARHCRVGRGEWVCGRRCHSRWR